MDNPKVSVIFPTYNRPHFLKESIDSILNQDFEDFEICILDHGSGPATFDVLHEYRKEKRLRHWRFEVNRAPGAPCGFCYLGGKARGEYIVLFSDDDHMLTGCLSKKVHILDAHPECGFVFSAVFLLDVKGRSLGKTNMNQPTQCDRWNATPFNELFVGNRIIMPSGMFRREFMPLFEQPFGVLNDWAFWLEIAHRTKSAWIPEPTIEYRLWNGTDSKMHGAKSGEFLKMYPNIWKRWMNDGHRPTPLEYEKMKKNMVALAEQQIALIQEEFPPKKENVLSMLKKY